MNSQETRTKTVVTHVTYRRPNAVRVRGVSRYRPVWIDRDLMHDVQILVLLSVMLGVIAYLWLVQAAAAVL